MNDGFTMNSVFFLFFERNLFLDSGLRISIDSFFF